MKKSNDISSLLEVKNLSKSYPLPGRPHDFLQVFSDVSLIVEKGQSVAITGKSGTGKSTFLHVVAGLDRADSGQVFYQGEDIFTFSDKRISAFRSRNIGFIFQANHLLSDFSARENLVLTACIGGTPERQAIERASYLLEAVGLAERASHRPYEMSGGELQRVAIARAVMNSPDIIFADEPTGSLDEENAQMVEALLFSLVQAEQSTLFLVTHNDTLAGRCDRHYVLKHKQLE